MMWKIFLFTCLVILISIPAGAFQSDEYFNHLTWEQILQKEAIVDYPIIFLHGIAGDLSHWEKTIKTIAGSNYFEMRFYLDEKIYHNYYGEKPGLWVWSVSYYTINPINESIYGDLKTYALRLQRMVDIIKKITHKDKVIIIAHSMGGLVARKYMTLDQTCWDSVHKILTVGTPHEGVLTSIGIVGQLEDLRKESEFIVELNQAWAKMSTNQKCKWGVVGALDLRLFFNKDMGSPYVTDSAGPGFVMISSAIPFGEWADALGVNFDKAFYNTPNFGFRVAVNSTHMGLLWDEGTFRGIHWALLK